MEKDIAELVIAHTKDLERLGIALIALLGVNILGLLGRYLVEDKLKFREVRVNKASIINNKKVTVQENLFHLLDELTLMDPGDSTSFLNKIQETDKYIRKNKLFIEKQITKISNDILDYHKSVLVNPASKNFEFEIEHLEKFTNEFTKL